MTQSNKPLTEMPDELCEELDALLREYKANRAKMGRLRRRQLSYTQPLRNKMADIINAFDNRRDPRMARCAEITREFIALWDEHLPGEKNVSLPSATAYPRLEYDIKVRNKRALIEVLDRLGRLELVDYVIDEKGLRKLVRDGLLKDVPAKVLSVKPKRKIQVYTRRED